MVNEREELELAEEHILRLEDALWFYADPGTYFGIAIWADAPTGGFDQDQTLDKWTGMDRIVPGQRARFALGFEDEEEPKELL